jgi:hypothetical protein
MLGAERELMVKQRRSFAFGVGREAASLVLDQGYSRIEAVCSLGLLESALRRREVRSKKAEPASALSL